MSGCVYATAGWGIHDARWVGALQDVGRVPVVVSLGRDVADGDELRRAVTAAAGNELPVLAGPLDTVTRHLVETGVRLVGLSWGYDLHDLDRDGADLTWLGRLDGLIVDSEANRSIALNAGVDPERITSLPWGVDLGTFAFHGPWVDAFQLGVPPHAPLVLSLRGHESIYRVGDILSAFARVPRPHGLHEDVPDPYLIVGHAGSLTSALRQQASDLGIATRTRFIGSVPEHDLAPLLGRAACYVTAAEVDGTSVTLLQAMACGTPVVASATPGNLGWIVDGVTGFTFPTGDVAALAEVLGRVTADYPTGVVLRARERVAADADWQANLGRLRRAMDAA
ncbi:MAG: glycosyltransferase [Actinobacteria bacterium]|nr:glycosyltransferase [Actinomycetota bacterium]